VKVPRSDIMKKILLTIDRHPSSIYDIQYSIANQSELVQTRLPKLLKSMEDAGLVRSALQPGPLGPYRRMYEPGPKAPDYLNESLKDAIETILHFYSINKRKNPRADMNQGKEPERIRSSGTILFAAYPHLTVDDLEEIRMLLSSMNEISIAVVGNDNILGKTGIAYQHLGLDLFDIEAESDSIAEIRIRGTPSKDNMLGVFAECKRILMREGILRITVPFVFSNESVDGKLESFIMSVVERQFSHFGLLDGEEIQRVLETHFSRNGSYETQLGETAFWAIKS
jgi:DNA-binding PadR family transcriptional regulator